MPLNGRPGCRGLGGRLGEGRWLQMIGCHLLVFLQCCRFKLGPALGERAVGQGYVSGLEGIAEDYGRELHVVLLDVGADEALAGQRARGRCAPPRVFARHQRGLDRLLAALPAPDAVCPGAAVRPVPASLADAASVVLLDQVSRQHVAVARSDR